MLVIHQAKPFSELLLLLLLLMRCSTSSDFERRKMRTSKWNQKNDNQKDIMRIKITFIIGSLSMFIDFPCRIPSFDS